MVLIKLYSILFQKYLAPTNSQHSDMRFHLCTVSNGPNSIRRLISSSFGLRSCSVIIFPRFETAIHLFLTKNIISCINRTLQTMFSENYNISAPKDTKTLCQFYNVQKCVKQVDVQIIKVQIQSSFSKKSQNKLDVNRSTKIATVHRTSQF